MASEDWGYLKVTWEAPGPAAEVVRRMNQDDVERKLTAYVREGIMDWWREMRSAGLQGPPELDVQIELCDEENAS